MYAREQVWVLYTSFGAQIGMGHAQLVLPYAHAHARDINSATSHHVSRRGAAYTVCWHNTVPGSAIFYTMPEQRSACSAVPLLCRICVVNALHCKQHPGQIFGVVWHPAVTIARGFQLQHFNPTLRVFWGMVSFSCSQDIPL